MIDDTKVSEIIVQAFREGKFAPSTGSTVGEEMEEALPALNSLVASLLGIELGEKLRDWPVPPNRKSRIPARYPLAPMGESVSCAEWSHPPVNSRILASNGEGIVVYFPESPRDGSRMSYTNVGATGRVTLNGNGRLIQWMPEISGIGGWRGWFYRADHGNWTCFNRLQLDSFSPLPPEFDDLLIFGLVIRLSNRFGVEPSATVAGRYGDMLLRLKKRYAQSEEMPAVYRADFPRPWLSL